MAAFDAGSIEARLELNRDAFRAGIEQAKAEGHSLEDSKFDANAGLNNDQLQAQIAKAKGDLDRLKGDRSNVLIGADDAELERKIAEAEAKLDELKRKEAEVGASGKESFGKAAEELGKIREQGDRTIGMFAEMRGRATEALDSVRGKSEEAARGLDHVARSADDAGRFTTAFGRSAAQAVGNVSPLILAGPALASALLPVLGLAAGATLGLAGAMTVAGVSVGALGLLTHPILGALKEDFTTLAPLMKAYDQAQPGQAQVQAWNNLQAAIAKLPPDQRMVVSDLVDLKRELADLSNFIKPDVYDAFNQFLGAAHELLPQLVAPADQAAKAFGDWGRSLRTDFQSPGFHAFMNFVTGNTRIVLDQIGHSVGNLASGFGHLFMDTEPMMHDFLNGLVHITDEFNRWSQGRGQDQLQHFMDWVHANGPQVGKTLEDLARAVGSIATALGSTAGLNLQIIDAIANTINFIARIPGIGPAAAEIGLLALALQKFGLLGPIVSILQRIGGYLLDAVTGMRTVGVEMANAGARAQAGATDIEAAGARAQAGGAEFGRAGALAAEGSAGFGEEATAAQVAATRIDEAGAQAQLGGAGFTRAGAAAGEGGMAGGLRVAGGSAAALTEALIPLAPALIGVVGGAGLLYLAITGLHNNFSGLVQVESTGEPIFSAANTRILEQRAAVQQLNDEVAHAGPAWKGLVNQIDQALGNLPPDLAQKGAQAEQALADAIRGGQAPSMASTNAAAILTAYNQLLQIPGIGAQVMGALSSAIDSHGKDLGQTVLDQVHGLISQYGQLGPGVQQQVLKAMSDLQAGLATGNTGMINNAKAQLALLTAAYGQAGTNIVATGNAAFGRLATDVQQHTAQLTATTQYAVGLMIAEFSRMPGPIQDAATHAMSALDQALQSGNSTAIASASSGVESIIQNYTRLPPAAQQQADAAMTNLDNALRSGNPALIAAAEANVKAVVDQLNTLPGQTPPPGAAATASFAGGLNSGIPLVDQAAAGVTNAAKNGINPGDMSSQGASYSQSFAHGIESGFAAVDNALGAFQQKIAQFQQAQAAHQQSPDRRTFAIGSNYAWGLWAGLLSQLGPMEAALGRLFSGLGALPGGGAAGAFSAAMGSAPISGGSVSYTSNPIIHVAGDLTREAVGPLLGGISALQARDSAVMSELAARGWHVNRLPGAA